MFRRLMFAALVAAPVLWPASPRAEEPARLARALAEADNGQWAAALTDGRAAGALSGDIIEWRFLREGRPGDAAFADYTDFLRRHPDWPGLKLVRKAGEAAMGTGLAPDLVLSYFTGQPPQTGAGSLALAHALDAKGNRAAAEAEAVRGWRNLPMADADQAAFLAEFGPALSDQHGGRITAMLWQGEVDNARRMLPLVEGGTRAVAEARIALQTDAKDVTAKVKAVPAKSAGSAGLAWDRFRWRISRDLYPDAIALLLERSTSAEALGQPDEWADWRRKLARKEMREGDPRRAYKLASRHFLTAEDGEDYADLEWLAGYIALRKLGDAKLALQHFDRFAAAAKGPISLGRAGYWRGRALEKLGRSAQAQAAYAEGARYQTSFYGLLSAEKVGLPLSPAMKGGEAYPDWKVEAITGSSLYRAGRLLLAAGERPLAARFFAQMTEGMDGEDIGRLAGMALQDNQPYVALTMAKRAADKGVIWPTAYFPLVGLDHLKLPVRTELTLAIARRESEFNPRARSVVGALGLMQVMPQTGREMARSVGVAYDGGKLASDFDYNATLGSAYLAGLEAQFGTSPLLVASGYNAGPGRARKWMASFGDPRAGDVDPVDWVEAIPLRETQTYVMRVAESLPIYRARLTGKTGPVDFTAILRGQ
ncbi:MAG: lytic transglycosylase domain-containing protein [Proteobacteria bacterium]|nr:lytic transglycosylase domain-containing protein [Pseudomonadota bacterium]MBS0572967.1 lytic transglycosylase domain-containing protein [Pseudomonadota bacterium]